MVDFCSFINLSIWIFINKIVCLYGYMLHPLHPIHVYSSNQWFISIISKTERKQIFIYQIIRQNCLLHKIYRHSQAIWNFLWWLPCIFAIGDECNIGGYRTVAIGGYVRYIHYIAILHGNDKAFAKWKLLLNTICFTDGVFLPYYLLFYFCYFFQFSPRFTPFIMLFYKPST